MCRIIVECSTITGSYSLFRLRNIGKKRQLSLKKQTEIGRGCHREGGTSRGNLQFYLKTLSP